MAYYARQQHLALRQSFGSIVLLIGAVMCVLVIGNILQVAIWASFFMYLDQFETFSVALYHSAVNFSTLGYGDIVMSEDYRMLGPLQALNGVLMVGVSTAMVMTTLQHALKLAIAERRAAGIGPIGS